MSKAQELFVRAKKVMPGGVCSSTRLNSESGRPFYISHGLNSKVYNYEGFEYVDMNCAHGAALLGHKHPAIVEAMAKAAELGYICSAETEYQIELAEKLCKIIPCMDKVRFCTSGSEATMHLLRACRGFTGRDKILRLEGHFHGYHEMIYIGGQPPMDKLAENRKKPYIESAGIPEIFRDLIVTAPFNDLDVLNEVIEANKNEIAVLMLEPVNYNSGGIKPDKGYLEAIRKITKENGIILFFDEIQASFKKSPGGAQEDFNIMPDVCTIGKSLGGGIPLSAFGGRAEIMNMYKPLGTVQHSGTFNAHLTQILPAIAFVDEVVKPYFYKHLQALEKRLHDGLDKIVSELGVPVMFPHHGARFNIVIGLNEPPRHYSDLKNHDHKHALEFFRKCNERGVYYHDYGKGSPGHSGYSIQHTEADIDRVLEVSRTVLKEIY
ncbi:MAG: Glutamate-1-semialdehyde 2,1-aminomutase [Candidatus Uhrbacteria bacterium GW2011_GWF2_39_13]|uniref:Glutamate-1-semialdehyde 2,1-aminomutase n=1 Tax=Candidatus Uhrbacteria bacterium GW2011_GWF2_39_13 TaxID=1618995 RepID=A0A0G0MI03_9BACT|nr:MAG: Glutamate-1-semialdehyde 2,1-aminomutase [Candidatus Uhrbacteria bacterium GW2011_GWF2_39_13]